MISHTHMAAKNFQMRNILKFHRHTDKQTQEKNLFIYKLQSQIYDDDDDDPISS